MSSLKRPRATEWGRGVDMPRDKRLFYEPECHGYDYEGQDLWQTWFENNENAACTQASISRILPAVNALSDDSIPSVQDLWQGQQGFDNSLCQVEEHTMFYSGQEFNLNPSIPAGYDLDAFVGEVPTDSGYEIATESSFASEPAPKTVEVCYGSVGIHQPFLRYIHMLNTTAL